MATPAAAGIRNVAFVGPHHSGKTTLVEGLLAHSGAIPRKGSVTEGTATHDHDAESHSQQMSGVPSFAHLQTEGVRVNIIDCPGAIDFFEETKFALLGADAAVIVVEADPTRIPQLELLVDHLEARKMPHCFVVNRLDRPGADFPETYAALRHRFGNHVVTEHLPIGQGENFAGYVDVVSMQAYAYGEGGKTTASSLPEHFADKNREELLEALADFDDHLMEEILEGKEPPVEEVERDLEQDVSAGKIVPVLVAAGIRGWGGAELLAGILWPFPDVVA